MLNSLLEIASPPVLVKLVQDSTSRHSTPGQSLRSTPFSAPRPTTPSAVVTLVSEIATLLLGSILLASEAPDQSLFTQNTSPSAEQHHSQLPSLQLEQIHVLVNQPLASDVSERLAGYSEGREALQQANEVAIRWWGELLGGNEHEHQHQPVRRNSLFKIGASAPEDETELSVSVLVRWLHQFRFHC